MSSTEQQRGSASELNELLCADFDLNRLIAARKMRTHCRKYTVDELLDEVVALYNKYYLPDIKKLRNVLCATECKKRVPL